MLTIRAPRRRISGRAPRIKARGAFELAGVAGEKRQPRAFGCEQARELEPKTARAAGDYNRASGKINRPQAANNKTGRAYGRGYLQRSTYESVHRSILCPSRS